MLSVVPWITWVVLFVLLGVTGVFSRKERRFFWQDPTERYWRLILGALLIASFCVVYFSTWTGELRLPLLATICGLAGIGILPGLTPKDDSLAARLAAMALPAAVIGLMQHFSLATPVVTIGLTAGIGCAAMALTFRARGRFATDVALVTFVAVCASALGGATTDANVVYAGQSITFIALAAGCVGLGLSAVVRKLPPWAMMALTLVLFVAGVFLLDRKFFYTTTAVTLVGSSVLATVVCGWFYKPDLRTTAFRTALLTLIYFGLATFAFMTDRGYGMAVVALGSLLTALFIGRRDLIPTMSPLFALVFYRVYRDVYPDTTRALDIGQHYALVGIVFGVLAVLAAVEWASSLHDRSKLRHTFAGLVAALVLIGGCMAAITVLGAKGSVGLEIGIGIAPFLAAYAGRTGLATTISSVALMAAVSIPYKALVALGGVERAAKIKLMILCCVVAALLALLAWVLTRGPKEEAQP